MLAGLADVVDKATAALEAYDHTRALELSETFFWTFCDDYLELVKDRAYGDRVRGDRLGPRRPGASPSTCCSRLFAPVLPFATEEVWSWWREGSVHRAPWPAAEPLRTPRTRRVVAAAGAALAALRKVKSEAKVLDAHRDHRGRRSPCPPRCGRASSRRSDDIRSAGRVDRHARRWSTATARRAWRATPCWCPPAPKA